MEKDTNENTGRIPRELLHDQQERLSNKHIKTLTFLQQLAKENKSLKERIKDLEESQEKCHSMHGLAYDSQEELKSIKETYLAHADEIAKLASEHSIEIMKLQEEKTELERGLKEQIIKMHHEIESLKAANNDLRETVAEKNEIDNKQQTMEILNRNIHY
ncbi:hypothetical protein Btru_072589 [Bulinus truncatus]|nr:hypothetical protein Btru_072589 [Bulinus truncatus]